VAMGGFILFYAIFCHFLPKIKEKIDLTGVARGGVLLECK